jgi:hypothetical protein
MQTPGKLLSPFLIVSAVLAAASAGAESTKVWSHKPDKGFIDDPMAFDGDEGRFAFVHTDSAQFMKIVVIKTSSFKPEVEIKVGDATLVPKGLHFTPDGRHLVFIWMDGYKGTHGAMLYALPSGKRLKKAGPATHAAVVAHKGKQLLVLTGVKTTGQGANDHTITAYHTKSFRRAGGGRITVEADLNIKKLKLRLLYWESGHASLVGMQKGAYDKKRDIRLPERGVRYDVLSRKVVWAEAPKEVVAWHKTTTMRPNHPGQLRFLEVSDDLKSLHYVDRNNNLGKVTTPVKWKLYEPKSLVQHESWDGRTLHFSMTVDPVNPDAVRRKKADAERVDIYRVDPGPKARPVGQVLTGKRLFRWQPGRRFFSYLVKLKGFSRGGKEIRIYRASR